MKKEEEKEPKCWKQNIRKRTNKVKRISFGECTTKIKWIKTGKEKLPEKKGGLDELKMFRWERV